MDDIVRESGVDPTNLDEVAQLYVHCGGGEWIEDIEIDGDEAYIHFLYFNIHENERYDDIVLRRDKQGRWSKIEGELENETQISSNSRM